jgi:hypothetical protein
MVTASQHPADDLDRRYEELYARFGKPLETTHGGQYLAVSPAGRTVLGATLLEVAQKARAEFGPGNFLYKIGPKAVGKWR